MPCGANIDIALARHAATVLESLPALTRLVLLLRVYDGWKSCEIAQATGYPLRTVRALETRGLNAVERALGSEPGGSLRLCVSAAFELLIENADPDTDIVARVRAYLLDIVASAAR